LGRQLAPTFAWHGPIKPGLLSATIPESCKRRHAIAQPTAKLLHVIVTVHAPRFAETVVTPSVIASQSRAAAAVCAWLVDSPLDRIFTPILPHHNNHVSESASRPLWERNRNVELSVGVHNACARAILIRSHVARPLSVLHVRLLNSTKTTSKTWVVIGIVQCCVPAKFVALHQVNFAATSSESPACIALSTVTPLHKIDASDAATASISDINLHAQGLAQ
jgi:hypothetical protein